MQTLHLRTTGRRTGEARRTPLYYVEDGDNVAIVTSNGGRDDDPAWWLNLQATPDAADRDPQGGASRPGSAGHGR